MVEVNVFNASGKKTGTTKIDDPEFTCHLNKPLLKQVILAYQNNTKHGTANTKTRGELSFSGVKPWRQKGTGRARAGTRSSPVWRSGGVVFGPKPFRKRLKVTSNMKKAALRQSISGKLLAEEVMLFDGMNLETPRTKTVCEFLKNMGVAGSNILIISNDESVYKSARNIKGVEVKACASINALDMLQHKYIVADKSDFEQLLQRAKNE